MSHYDDAPTLPGFRSLPPGSWDGTTEALAMGVVMEPPDGFLARAVARGLAVVEAEEALVAYREQRAPANDRPATVGHDGDRQADLDEEEPVTLRPMPRPTPLAPPSEPTRASGRGRHDSGVFFTPPMPDVEPSE